MSEHLSIANLLSLLEIDRQDDALRLCAEADSLRRRRRYAAAIEVAERAAHMTRNHYDRLGVALLYLSSIRASAHQAGQAEQAQRDSERAVRALSTQPHNHVIAQMIRGQIELEIDADANREAALDEFGAAHHSLQELILDSREHNRTQHTALYRSLEKSLTVQIEHLSAALAEVEPIEVAPKQTSADQSTPVPAFADQATIPTRPGQATPPPIKLAVPTKLIWPSTELPSIEVVATVGGAPLDSMGISELSIGGRAYKVHPIVPVSSSSGSLRLQHGQQYVTLQIEGANDQRVLIRRQERPDQRRQFIVVADSSKHQAWIDDAESIMPFKVVHIIGAEREWNIRDGSDTSLINENELRIIGIVEAILTPAESTEPLIDLEQVAA
jgi:hypothetical protein